MYDARYLVRPTSNKCTSALTLVNLVVKDRFEICQVRVKDRNTHNVPQPPTYLAEVGGKPEVDELEFRIRLIRLEHPVLQLQQQCKRFVCEGVRRGPRGSDVVNGGAEVSCCVLSRVQPGQANCGSAMV